MQSTETTALDSMLAVAADVARMLGVRAYVYQCGPDHFSCKLETPAPALGLLVAIFDPAGRSIARLPAPASPEVRR